MRFVWRWLKLRWWDGLVKYGTGWCIQVASEILLTCLCSIFLLEIHCFSTKNNWKGWLNCCYCLSAKLRWSLLIPLTSQFSSLVILFNDALLKNIPLISRSDWKSWRFYILVSLKTRKNINKNSFWRLWKNSSKNTCSLWQIFSAKMNKVVTQKSKT